MVAYSAFQSNAFQRNAFQIASSASVSAVPTRPDKEYSYTPYSVRYSQQQEIIAEQKTKLKLIEQEIAENERRKQELAARETKRLARNAAKKLAATEAMLQKEISRLRMERVWLMRRIDDEEAILIILMVKKRRVI